MRLLCHAERRMTRWGGTLVSLYAERMHLNSELTSTYDPQSRNALGFNPSRGIAIIQTRLRHEIAPRWPLFQSLTRDSNHSNRCHRARRRNCARFQSLPRDSNHSNRSSSLLESNSNGFNPSRGIAIIQTKRSAAQQPSSVGFNPSRGIAII